MNQKKKKKEKKKERKKKEDDDENKSPIVATNQRIETLATHPNQNQARYREMAMAFQLFQLPLASSSSSSSYSSTIQSISVVLRRHHHFCNNSSAAEAVAMSTTLGVRHRRRRRKRSSCRGGTVFASKEDTTELRVSLPDQDDQQKEFDPTPEDLEYVRQIQRVLELLKKNRDMLFSEVKLTIMIEDPRELERRRLLGIEDPDSPTREDLVAALEEVNEGKVPEDRFALQILAEEMTSWPNIEVEASKTKPSKSLYAKATDTGVNPQVAAKRLNIDWDSAAEINDSEVSKDTDVPAAVGYGALYLVTAFPVIIGISVVLILFYNSLQ